MREISYARLPPTILPPSAVSNRLLNRHGLSVRVGFELEFYIRPAPVAPLPFIDGLESEIRLNHPMLLSLKNEAGPGQFEICTKPTYDPDAGLRHLDRLRAAVDSTLARFSLAADWRSSPLSGYPGSALHVHLSLYNSEGNNVFCRGCGGEESEVLLRVVNGMLETLPDLMPVFAPTESCYQRYMEIPFPEVAVTPSRVCWGPDNRAAALRLPPCGATPDARRIEHRVAGASANPASVLSAILVGACAGLEARGSPRHPPAYGHPGNPLYDFQRIPASFAEARVPFLARGQTLLGSYTSL